MTGPGLGGRTLANINMDMVGEHLELLHSRMIMTRTPASIPSALNDVAGNMAQMVDRMNVRTPRGSLSRFNFAVTPYSGGSDHMMFIDRKIPGMMFGHSPDYTHHTSEDTPDKVDPVELERSEIIATATMLYLSDLTEEEAVDLVYLVGANAAGRLGAAARRARQVLDEEAPSADQASYDLLVANWADPFEDIGPITADDGRACTYCWDIASPMLLIPSPEGEVDVRIDHIVHRDLGSSVPVACDILYEEPVTYMTGGEEVQTQLSDHRGVRCSFAAP